MPDSLTDDRVTDLAVTLKLHEARLCKLESLAGLRNVKRDFCDQVEEAYRDVSEITRENQLLLKEVAALRQEIEHWKRRCHCQAAS